MGTDKNYLECGSVYNAKKLGNVDSRGNQCCPELDCSWSEMKGEQEEGNGNRKANTVEKYNISEERKPAKKWIFKNGNTYNEAFNGQEMQEVTELDFLGMGMSSKSASLSKEDKENRGKQKKGKKWKFKSPSSNQPPLDQSETAEPDFLGTDMSSKSAQTSKISEDRKEEW